MFLRQLLKGCRDNEKKYFTIDDPEDLLQQTKQIRNTLVDKFKISGFPYNESTKFEKNLSYRDIEKTLISIQTNLSVKFLIFYVKSKNFSEANFVSRTSGIDFSGGAKKNGREQYHKIRE